MDEKSARDKQRMAVGLIPSIDPFETEEDYDMALVRVGQQCQALIDSEVWDQAIGDLRSTWVDASFNTDLSDSEAREHYYQMVTCIDAIKARIETGAAVGQQAAQRLSDPSDDEDL